MIRQADIRDTDTVARLMRALWPDHSMEEMREEANRIVCCTRKL